nr:MAG TPA: hypothetical protein [Caudoviricetes sp.]
MRAQQLRKVRPDLCRLNLAVSRRHNFHYIASINSAAMQPAPNCRLRYATQIGQFFLTASDINCLLDGFVRHVPIPISIGAK